jgi:hypothetical protein
VSFVAHAIAVFVIGAAVVALGLALAFVLARGYVRRHWRLMRGHPATRGVLAAFALVSAWRERSAQASPTEQSRGSAARVRRRMWVAVEDAEAAVAHASDHEAPVAELPAVCRSLRAVAGELDGLLRLERRLPAPAVRTGEVRRQVADVIAAARDVQLSALRSGSDATEPQVRSLVRHARDEVDIVSAALAHLRSVARPS